MRKTFVLIAILGMVALGFAQSISNVRLVPAKTSYNAGESVRIYWNYTGLSIPADAPVKITLWREGGTQNICLIAADVQINRGNTGYAWTIPATCTNPHTNAPEDLTTSRLKIRVRWQGHPVWGETVLFRITNVHIPPPEMPTPIPGLARPDLKVKTNETTLQVLQSHTVAVSFHTAIENAGRAKATNIKLRLRITGPPVSPLNNHSETATITSLPLGILSIISLPSGQPTIPYNKTFYIHTPGTYHFTFTVDPDNTISEINENNNTITRNIIIDAPDLIVWLRNPKVYMSKKQTLYIGVLNIGTKTSGITSLKVHIPGKGTKMYQVPMLGPCGYTFIKRGVRFYTHRDTWVEMTIDPENQITELRKDNNFTRTKLDVRALGHFGARVSVPPPVNLCWKR